MQYTAAYWALGSLYEFCGFSFIILSQDEEISVSIPCPWHSFGFKSLFGLEILSHTCHWGLKNEYWERQITLSVSHETNIFLSGSCSRCPVFFQVTAVHLTLLKREIWLLTWAQVCQWCTDSMTRDLSPLRSKQDMGFYTHTLSCKKWTLYSSTHDLWPPSPYLM